MYYDSQSTIHLTKNQMFYKRSKHIDVNSFYYGCDCKGCYCNEKKIPIMENLADMMTKSVFIVKLRYYLDLIDINSI